MKKDKKQIMAEVFSAKEKNIPGKALPLEKNPLPVYPVADDIYSMDSEVDVDPDYLSAGAGTGNGETGAGPAGPSAQAVVPIDGNWLEFSFDNTSTDAVDCAGGCLPSSGGNSQDAGSPPWTSSMPRASAIASSSSASRGARPRGSSCACIPRSSPRGA